MGVSEWRVPTIARAHGLFNVASGLWPLLHMRSFEAVSGPKVDRWLVETVAGLMVVNGVVQLTAADSSARVSRTLGAGTALCLAAVDLRYATTGRISKVYLLDAAVELAWVAVWACTMRLAGSAQSARR